jgi:hypothetical protein
MIFVKLKEKRVFENALAKLISLLEANPEGRGKYEISKIITSTTKASGEWGDEVKDGVNKVTKVGDGTTTRHAAAQHWIR